MLLLNEQLRAGEVTDESVDAVLDGIAALADDPPRGTEGLFTATNLARLALEAPMGLMRGEALRVAWLCVADRPARAWRVDEVDLTTFVERTRRIEELMLAVDEPSAEERAEFTELVTWLAEVRVSPERIPLAVDIADVVTSRSVEELTGGVVLDEEGAVLHALTLVTLHLAGDAVPVARRESAATLRYLHPSIGLEVLAALVLREVDSLVLIRALDALADRVDDYPPEELGELLDALAAHPDPSVARRARELSAG